jgi:asparagine N-glycosylation enzyme membrane subunit Stt3
MPKYQVNYKNNSKTFNDIFYAKNEDKLIEFIKAISNVEILEIRKYVYEKNKLGIDDKNYKNDIKVEMSDKNNFHRVFKIPKIKKNIKNKDIFLAINKYLKMNKKKPFLIKIFD